MFRYQSNYRVDIFSGTVFRAAVQRSYRKSEDSAWASSCNSDQRVASHAEFIVILPAVVSGKLETRFEYVSILAAYGFFLLFSYEDRAKSLETVVRNHKDANTFEEFTAQIVSPSNASPSCSGPSRTSGNKTYLDL